MKALKPFWYKTRSNKINPPYVYGSFIVALIVLSCILFGILAWLKYDAAILMAISSVIGILSGLYYGIIQLYDKSKKPTVSQDV
jgi:hypothetical protein